MLVWITIRGVLFARRHVQIGTIYSDRYPSPNSKLTPNSFGLFRMGCGRRAFDPAAWSSQLQGSLGEEQVTDISVIFRLAIALALGLIIGMERGWQSRDSPESLRSAGFRSFGFVRLFGGVSVLRGDLHCIGYDGSLPSGVNC
jgi:hypothetical protein